jgi:hypothetical protein
LIAVAETPEDLAEHAEEEFGVGRGELKAAKEAADFLGGESGGRRLEVAAGRESVEQKGSEAFEAGGVGEVGTGGSRVDGSAALLRLGGRREIAGEFVEADGDGLTEIHGAVGLPGGNVEQPVAVAEIVIGEASFFGAEDKSDAARGEAFADEARGESEWLRRVRQIAARLRGGADDESAIGDGFSDGLELFRAGEKDRSSDSGTGFAEGEIVGINDAKTENAEVAHGAGGGAKVEGIAGGDEDDAEAVEFGRRRHGRTLQQGGRADGEDVAVGIH